MSRFLSWKLEQISVFLAFLLGAIVFTWPIAKNFTTYIPGGTGDEWTVFWPFWYIPRALLTDKWSILYSNLQLFPDGFFSIYHSSSFIGTILTAPVSLAVNPTAALNVWLLFQLSAGAFFFYKLCRSYEMNRVAAVAGGFLYGYSPFVSAHIGGHYTLVQVATPAAALFLLRKTILALTQKESAKSVLSYSALLGVTFSLTATSDFYLGVMLILLLGAFAFGSLIETPAALKKSLFWISMLTAIAAAGLLTLPWLFELNRVNDLGDYTARYPAAGSQVFASWKSLMLPTAGHIIYTLWPSLITLRENAGILESTYLGVTALVLSCFALVTLKTCKTTAVLLIALVAFLLLSTGNVYTEYPGIPRPLNFGKLWPMVGILEQFRVPARWHFAAVTVLAFLAAKGVQFLLDRSNRWYRAAAVFSVLVLAVDTWPGRMAITPSTADNWFLKNKLPGKGTLLAFPVGIASGSGGGIGLFQGTQLLDQMEHERPLLSGYLGRISNTILDQRRSDKELSALLQLQAGETVSNVGNLNWEDFISRYDIAYILLPDGLQSGPLHKLVTSKFPVSETTQTLNFLLLSLR